MGTEKTILSWQTVRSLPVNLTVEVGSQCNLKCVMCPLILGTSSTSQAVTFLSADLWHSLVRHIEGEVESICFAGYGEPTLHKKFHLMLLDLDRLGIRSSFSTNATVVSQDLLDTLPRLSTLTHVNVSVDSPNPDVYRKIRRGKLEKVLRNVERLAKTAKRFAFTVSSVAMVDTVGTLKEFPPILAGLGVRHYVVQSLVHGDQSIEGGGRDLYRHDEAETAIRQIREAADAFELELRFEMPRRIDLEAAVVPQDLSTYFGDARSSDAPERQSRDCLLPWQSAHIDANGDVFPCCHASAENKSKLGSLREATLTEIWQGPAFHEFRESLLLKEGRTCPEVCAACTVTPRGLPALVGYDAAVVSVAVVKDTVEVVVQNTGTLTWSRPLQPLVGTSWPRDRLSPAADTSWIAPHRAARPLEDFVEPGEHAHYRFKLGDGLAEPERFELVVDGVLWLPNSAFLVQPRPRHVLALAATDITQEQVDRFKWWHSIDFGKGIASKGTKTRDMLEREFEIVFRHGVNQKSVYDIGAWDGAFSFEARRRGATGVVATDGAIWANAAPWTSRAPFDFANIALGAGVHGMTMNIYDMSHEIMSPRDVVLFLGVLYHLQHPLLALQRVADLTRDYAVIETETSLDMWEEPVMKFFPGSEFHGDRSNWCAPNIRCMVAWLKTVGFRAIECMPSPYFTEAPNDRRGRYIIHAWK
jgi:tRNA (mo5U34)-methyltransferase